MNPRPQPRIVNGNGIDAMPAGSADLILTDPPYRTRHSDRDGRRIVDGDNDKWLDRSYAQMHRVLKKNAYAITFHGWPKVDLGGLQIRATVTVTAARSRAESPDVAQQSSVRPSRLKLIGL